MNMKNIALSLTALVLFFGCAFILSCGNADAEEPAADQFTVTQGGCTYTVDEASSVSTDPFVVLTSFDGVTKEIEIPSTIKISVTIEQQPRDIECRIVIDESVFNFKDNAVIESLKFLDGAKRATLKTSGNNPIGIFSNCANLSTVVFGTSAPVDITDKCFQDCTKLSSVTFDDGIVTISQYAFDGCESLNSLEFKIGLKDVANYAFQDCPVSNLVLNEGLVNIGMCAFKNNQLNSLVIPNSVTNIGKMAFAIDDFSDVRNHITELVMSDHVSSIGNGAFCGCRISEVDIPATLTSLRTAGEGRPWAPDKIYDGLASTFGFYVEKFIVSSDNPNYSSIDGVLYKKDLTNLIKYPTGKTGPFTVPDSVTTISTAAFNKCGGLTTVTLNDKITSFSSSYIFTYSSLQSIDLSKITTLRNSNIFTGCENLTSVMLSPALERIGTRVFMDCINLELSSLPDSVNNIGKEAFKGCAKLNISSLPKNLTIIGQDAFNGTGIESIRVGEFSDDGGAPISVNVGAYAFYECDNLTNFEIVNISTTYLGQIANGEKLKTLILPEDFALWKQVGSLQMSNDGKTIYTCLNGCTDDVIVPSDAVFSSLDFPFKDCKFIKNIEFEEYTKNITLASAFTNCTSLESVKFSGTMNLGDLCFKGCDSLRYIEFASGNIGSKALNWILPGETHENFRFIGLSDELYPDVTELQNFVFLKDGNGYWQRASQSSGAIIDDTLTYSLYGDFTLSNDLVFTGPVELIGSLTVVSDTEVSGALVSFRSMAEFDEYCPLADSVILGSELLILDDSVEYLGTVKETSRVQSVSAVGFAGENDCVEVDINLYGAGVPNGELFIQYSAYLEIDGELFLNPFKTVSYAVDESEVLGDSTVLADVGEKMLSCIVSYTYDYAGMQFSTSVSECIYAMPAESIQLEAPADVTVSLGGKQVSDGDCVAYGNYSVALTGPEGKTYTLNGVPVTESFAIVYYGQKIVIALAEQA